MSAADRPSNADGPSRTDAIPPRPLTREQLTPIADQDAIDAVWVPSELPERVYTLAGAHQGRILEFYVETETAYVKFRYAPGDGVGLAWRRHEPISKDADDVELVESVLEDDYEPLVDALDGGDP